MIPRYTLPEMGAVWDERAKYRHWTKIELLACDAWAAKGVIPKEDLELIHSRVQEVDPARVDEIEQVTQHDVIAFLTTLGEPIGPASRWIHYGMTSSDLLDTALALQMLEACDILISKTERLARALKERALSFRDTVCVGRSHGVHAEPTTFGLKMAGWAFEVARDLTRLRAAREEVAVGTLSGPVGSYASIDPDIEASVCAALGLKPEDAATQVVARDRHAALLATLGIIASSLERIAIEVRHLQRTEVREVEEPFGAGQKGSSAMPHKRNPILCERIAGLARVVRANALPAMENIALWHERDISHSSVERVILPDSTIALDYMLHLTIKVVEGMRVFPERMKANLDATRGLVYSAHVLLAVVDAGLTREDAYAVVQRAAMKTWEEDVPFAETLVAEGAPLSKDDLEKLMDPQRYLAHAGTVFERLEALTV